LPDINLYTHSIIFLVSSILYLYIYKIKFNIITLISHTVPTYLRKSSSSYEGATFYTNFTICGFLDLHLLGFPDLLDAFSSCFFNLSIFLSYLLYRSAYSLTIILAVFLFFFSISAFLSVS
jgi:hypothetical protein